MSAEENQHRAEQAAAGLVGFMQRLTDAVEQHQRGRKKSEEEWDEHDYEKFLRESDARTEKYKELQELYGDSPQAEELIAKAMGWDSVDREAGDGMTVEEINAICEEALNEPLPEPDPLREDIDWIRTEDGEVRHPLQHRCYQSAFRFRQNVEMLGHTLLEHPKVDEATFEFLTTAIKLAGALNGLAPGDTFFEHGLTVALLKRALGHLHRAQAGLEAVASEDLLPSPLIEEARQEMFAIREEIIRLMDRLRGRR
jgi:hypothetical protein